ncbi:hypothetical protein [Microbacterium sp. TWP3-1-2b2]|uniref:hypothetical protein n=1 Tax=Microbacterium sp. TWP3-1-2b2 TaxID=2804651 RepID=UPI003CF25948
MIRIADGFAILRALDGVEGRPIEWAELGTPVIDRGAHAIFPIAVASVQDAASSGLQEMRRRLEMDLVHFYGGDGFHAEMLLDLDAGYGRRLVETSVLVRAPRYWWGIGRFAVVLVQSVEQRREFETLALHIIPKDWVWYSPITPTTKRAASHLRRVIREQETIGGVADVVWSWPSGTGAQG